ncbi:MAG TPA: SUF system NifU family Fe-S cluster assembly protein [Actinomycetes bacterium]|jgi:nitrogen fixation NifU-like protein|nr:SUF system NifU family Fe-S cluster assembly protein [Actinomycetes bacterium]
MQQLESMYQEIILDHYRRPVNAGLREPYDAEVLHVNPTCGDEVRLRVRLVGDRIADVSYETEGCSISQASTSVMSELVIDRTVGEALKLADSFSELMASKGQLEPDEDVLGDAIAFAGVSKYPARIKCALLGWMAWKDASTQALAAGGAGAGGDAGEGAAGGAGGDAAGDTGGGAGGGAGEGAAGGDR